MSALQPRTQLPRLGTASLLRQVTLRDFQPAGVAETCCPRSKVVAGLLVLSALGLV